MISKVIVIVSVFAEAQRIPVMSDINCYETNLYGNRCLKNRYTYKVMIGYFETY